MRFVIGVELLKFGKREIKRILKNVVKLFWCANSDLGLYSDIDSCKVTLRAYIKQFSLYDCHLDIRD